MEQQSSACHTQGLPASESHTGARTTSGFSTYNGCVDSKKIPFNCLVDESWKMFPQQILEAYWNLDDITVYVMYIYIYINVCFLFLYISTTDKETTWTGWRVNSFYLDPCMLSPSMSFGGKKTCWSLAFDVEVGWWSWRSQACLVDLMWRIALPDMLLSFRISDMALGIPLKTRLQGSIWPPHLLFSY